MSELANKVQNALAAIGRKNGTSYSGTSQDPIDRMLHLLYVDRIGTSFFTKQKEETQKEVLAYVKSEDVARIIEATKKFQIGQSDSLLNSENYTLLLTTKKGAATFDKAEMKKALIKAGVKMEIIDAAMKAGEKQNEPAKTFEVVQS